MKWMKKVLSYLYSLFFVICTESRQRYLKNSPFDVGSISKEAIQGFNAGIRAQITESHFDFWCLKNRGLFLSRVETEKTETYTCIISVFSFASLDRKRPQILKHQNDFRWFELWCRPQGLEHLPWRQLLHRRVSASLYLLKLLYNFAVIQL